MEKTISISFDMEKDSDRLLYELIANNYDPEAFAKTAVYEYAIIATTLPSLEKGAAGKAHDYLDDGQEDVYKELLLK